MFRLFLCRVIHSVATKITHLESVDSTQQELLRRVRSGTASHGEVILSDFQSEGIGAGGTHWSSKAGDNLLMSMALKFTNRTTSSPLMSMSLALSIHDVVQSYLPSAKIKWPNDILVKGKKIAGILVNNTFNGSTIHWTVWGVGINVEQTKFSPMPTDPTSFKLENVKVSKERVMEEILAKLTNAWWLVTAGNHSRILDMYNTHLFALNTVQRFKLREKTMDAKVKMVNFNGALILETDQGEREFYHKEIEWIL